MIAGIICASDEELAPFLSVIEHCKVNAAIASQIMIDDFGVSILINAGTAGGMDAIGIF